MVLTLAFQVKRRYQLIGGVRIRAFNDAWIDILQGIGRSSGSKCRGWHSPLSYCFFERQRFFILGALLPNGNTRRGNLLVVVFLFCVGLIVGHYGCQLAKLCSQSVDFTVRVGGKEPAAVGTHQCQEEESK